MSAQTDQKLPSQPSLSTSISSSGSTSPNSFGHANYFASLTGPLKNDVDIDFSSQCLMKPCVADDSDIKIQVYYCGLIMVIYIKNSLKIEQFCAILKDICKFDEQQLFTIKWVDEEGDPCTVSSQSELDEALRLYYVNKESELVVHVFANIPERPGTQCAGEDRSIYRRGARRWRKIYLVNGHKYQAKRFARTALCGVCQDRIWGLGRQGYKCLECKIMVHKRCHKFIKLTCNEILVQQQQLHQQQLNSYMSTSSAPPAIPSSFSSHSIGSGCHQNSALIEDLKQAQKKQANLNKNDLFAEVPVLNKTSSPIIGKNKSFNAKLSNLLNKQSNAADKSKNEIDVDCSVYLCVELFLVLDIDNFERKT
ncbi:kinase C iota type [Brachionus plicatilis]|uniref:Kinase C iota type n=1 Tax=Brachionus plicatilis TaxID=10195 RepID=A0A3M7SNV4_BRAPC|nr:kinase C iota type [Brachionus plicatilis]